MKKIEYFHRVEGCVVYLFYSASNNLLYVGTTTNCKRRIEEHKKTKWWFKQVKFYSVIPVVEYKRFILEEMLIRTLIPTHNTTHSNLEVPIQKIDEVGNVYDKAKASRNNRKEKIIQLDLQSEPISEKTSYFKYDADDTITVRKNLYYASSRKPNGEMTTIRFAHYDDAQAWLKHMEKLRLNTLINAE